MAQLQSILQQLLQTSCSCIDALLDFATISIVTRVLSRGGGGGGGGGAEGKLCQRIEVLIDFPSKATGTDSFNDVASWEEAKRHYNHEEENNTELETEVGGIQVAKQLFQINCSKGRHQEKVDGGIRIWMRRLYFHYQLT